MLQYTQQFQVKSRWGKNKNTKRVIRNRKSKKDRQYNGKKKNDEEASDKVQSTPQKTKNRATWSHKKTVPVYCHLLASSLAKGYDPLYSSSPLASFWRIFEVTRWRFICNAASGSCNQSEWALQKAHVL